MLHKKREQLSRPELVQAQLPRIVVGERSYKAPVVFYFQANLLRCTTIFGYTDFMYTYNCPDCGLTPNKPEVPKLVSDPL